MQCYITLMRNCSQKFPILEYRKSLIQTCWCPSAQLKCLNINNTIAHTAEYLISIGFLSRDQFSLDQLSRTLTRSTQFYYVKINARVDLVAIDLVTPSLKFHLMHKSISLFEGFG